MLPRVVALALGVFLVLAADGIAADSSLEKIKRQVIERFATDSRLIKAGFTPSEIEYLLGGIVVAKTRLVQGKKTYAAKELREIYRNNFLHEAGYTRGREYLENYVAEFAVVENDFGVPREVVAAILWVETKFEENIGEHPALDVLFFYVIRAEARGQSKKLRSATEQLRSFLLLFKRQALDARTTRSSYAGALGLPQFMPYSYIHFAVDGDYDGKIDLFKSHADAIVSVANYLEKHGARKKMRRAILAYNHSTIYVDTVLEYAEKIREHAR